MIISRVGKGIGIYQEPEKNEEKRDNASKTDHQNASLMFNIMASVIGMNKAGNLPMCCQRGRGLLPAVAKI